MKTLGIDIGGSTTKMVIMDNGIILSSHQFSYGGRLNDIDSMIMERLNKSKYTVNDIEKIVLTGVGSSYIDTDVCGINTYKVDEFEALGAGAKMLSDKSDMLIVSMGTGTAFVRLKRGKAEHIGGSGVGGGTLIGLSKLLVDVDDIMEIIDLAKNGDLSKIDLQMKDICDIEIPNLPMHATAANFGKIMPNVNKSDSIAGLLNMIYQTIGMFAVFACNGTDVKDIILTGTMATLAQGNAVFEELGKIHGVNFIVPANAVFCCAIGAVLSA